MNPNWEYIRNTIDKFPEYRSAIFEQGFILTNRQLSLGNGFPFFGNWRCEKLSGGLFAYVHVTQKLYLFKKNNTVYFLLGHAYDPFAYQWDENEILSSLADCSDGDFEKGLAKINDLTGLFVLGMINGEKITFCGDFESMRTAYYGCINGSFYLVSHEELAAFFEELHFDPYVRKLEQYRWYRLYGEGLPCNISHYLELKKLVANNCIVFAGGSFRTVRIWPRGEIEMCASEDVYEKVVDDIARIMQRSLELIAKKWARPAISATGGRDSKGSLAASVHIRERFQYFSYDSQPAERVDCDAAEAICRAAGVPHDTYRIPLDRQLYPEYELVKAIHCANSNRLYFNHNDLMKRIYFRKAQRFDVEVKSWTSEIGRAFCYQRYRAQAYCAERHFSVQPDPYVPDGRPLSRLSQGIRVQSAHVQLRLERHCDRGNARQPLGLRRDLLRAYVRL